MVVLCTVLVLNSLEKEDVHVKHGVKAATAVWVRHATHDPLPGQTAEVLPWQQSSYVQEQLRPMLPPCSFVAQPFLIRNAAHKVGFHTVSAAGCCEGCQRYPAVSHAGDRCVEHHAV